MRIWLEEIRQAWEKAYKDDAKKVVFFDKYAEDMLAFLEAAEETSEPPEG